MAIQWNESLAVGVEMIDNQHKGIFSRVNNLLNAMAQGKGRDEVGKVIAVLADYVVKHYSAEEAIMAKHNYNDLPSQKAEHTQFIKDFSGLKKEFETKGVTPHLVIQVQQKVCNWLTYHIGNEDKKIGAFLKTKG
ncbi:MAG: bacteriohemerythrin [Candidatus Brocadia sp.]